MTYKSVSRTNCLITDTERNKKQFDKKTMHLHQWKREEFAHLVTLRAVLLFSSHKTGDKKDILTVGR